MDMRVGIIGCGNIFPMHAESISNTEGLELRAVCDVKKEKARRAAKKYNCAYYLDYEKMLDEESLDSVHILTPHHLHSIMTIAAAERKIHILTEKPISIDPQDARKMIDIAKQNDVRLGVIFQNRYNPGSQLVKKNLENGNLGRIKSARLVLSYHKPDSYYKQSDWKGTWDKEGGGVLIDQAIHFIDCLRWFINDEVEYVQANIANRMHSSIEVEDMAEGVIRFKKGTYVCFYLINFYSYDADVEIEMDCTKGRVKIVKDSARIGFYDGKILKAQPRPNEYIDYGKGRKDYWGFCHWLQIKQFYQAIRNNQEPQINGIEGLRTQEIVWNIYKSAEEKKRIYF